MSNIDFPRRHNAQVQRDRQQRNQFTATVPETARLRPEEEIRYDEGDPAYYTTSEPSESEITKTPRHDYPESSTDNDDDYNAYFFLADTSTLSINIGEDDMSKSQVLFFGKPHQLDQLQTYVEIKFITDDEFSENKKKQAAYFASLFRGPALAWLTKERKEDPGLFNSYPALLSKTHNAFGQNYQTRMQQANRQITNINQRGSVQQHALHFQQLIDILQWNDEAAKAHFLRSLKRHIREALIAKGTNDYDLNELYTEAIRIDEELFTAKRDTTYGNRRYATKTGFKGKCNSCGKFGHKARECKATRDPW